MNLEERMFRVLGESVTEKTEIEPDHFIPDRKIDKDFSIFVIRIQQVYNEYTDGICKVEFTFQYAGDEMFLFVPYTIQNGVKYGLFDNEKQIKGWGRDFVSAMCDYWYKTQWINYDDVYEAKWSLKLQKLTNKGEN